MVKCYALGCTISNRERAGVLFKFPKDAKRAQLWAQNIGMPCSVEDAKKLYGKFLCKDHFLKTDFTTPEKKRLNRGAVPCSSDSASQHPTPQLPDSALTDLNSLPSVLSPQKNLHVQAPSRTYGKLPVSSCSIQTPLSILEDTPGTSSQICAVKSTPPAASMFAVEDISCPLTLHTSDGEFRRINRPNPSSKRRARHSLLRELNLATVSQFVWRRLKEAGFKYLETRNLNQDPLENTFGVIRLHCGSNNNPTVGQFVDALKTSIINGLAFRDLRNTNCEDDKAELLDNLHSFLEESDASLPHPPTNHGTGTDGAVPIHVAEQVQEEVLNCDMKLLSVAYVSCFIARRVLRGINCVDCTTCLTSPMLLGPNAFIHFKEYKEDKQLLTYPSEKLVETVGASISLLESKMAKVAHMGSVEEKVTVAIKEAVDFGWIGSSGCLLHSQKIVDDIVRGVTRIAIPWWCKRKNRSLNEAKRQRAIKRKLKILSHK